MIRAVIGLGSNLGDRLAHLQAATARIGRIAKIERGSHVYETEPVGGVEQGKFYNAALLVQYEGEPLDLLDALQSVELAGGRMRSSEQRWGPRTIDLDILWVDGLAMESERLTIPHPQLVERAFALRPLVDVEPDAVDPMSNIPFTRLFDAEAARLMPLPYDLFGAS